MPFYVKTPADETPKGPFEISDVVLHIENAWLPENATVAQSGSHQWVPITEVPDFAVAFGRLRSSGLAAPVVNAPVKAKPYIPPGKLSCPQCHHAASGGRGCFVTGLCMLLAPFLIGIIIWLLIKPRYKCETCGYAFQP